MKISNIKNQISKIQIKNQKLEKFYSYLFCHPARDAGSIPFSWIPGQARDDTRGFTLIELLATMIVVLTVGAVMGGILFSAARSNNKASTLTTVKQNGTYAISQMSKMIRYAKSFDGVTTDATSGSPVYTTDCVQPTVAPLTPTPTPVDYKRVKITSFDGGSSTFWCEPVGASPATISSNSASLLDTTAVLVNTCSFACAQASINDPPVINIDFNLQQRKSTLFAEQQSKLDFHTSVAFRNWTR